MAGCTAIVNVLLVTLQAEGRVRGVPAPGAPGPMPLPAPPEAGRPNLRYPATIVFFMGTRHPKGGRRLLTQQEAP